MRLGILMVCGVWCGGLGKEIVRRSLASVLPVVSLVGAACISEHDGVTLCTPPHPLQLHHVFIATSLVFLVLQYSLTLSQSSKDPIEPARSGRLY